MDAMIKTTVQEVRDAYRAFRRINEEVRLPQKPAWRVSRLLNKLKPVVRDFEETQLKLFLDVGGIQIGGGVQMEAPELGDEESTEAFAERRRAYNVTINGLNEELRQLNDEEVEIDYDPLPISLFSDEEKTPKEKQRQFSANDFADAGPFLTETDKKE